MYVECDCNLTSGESIVRQILHGKKFFKDELGNKNATEVVEYIEIQNSVITITSNDVSRTDSNGNVTYYTKTGNVSFTLSAVKRKSWTICKGPLFLSLNIGLVICFPHCLY